MEVGGASPTLHRENTDEETGDGGSCVNKCERLGMFLCPMVLSDASHILQGTRTCVSVSGV